MHTHVLMYEERTVNCFEKLLRHHFLHNSYMYLDVTTNIKC